MVGMPILAQRLLINMRKVDYLGSKPIASKLLFTPPEPGSEDDIEGDSESVETVPRHSTLHNRGPPNEMSGIRNVGRGSSDV